MYLLPLFACVNDQGLAGKGEDAQPPGETALETDAETAESVADSPDSPAAEECNGVDDDGDGEVDEGFPDDDANGRVDCLDADCPPLSVAEPGAVPPLETCDGEPVSAVVVDPWSTAVVWELSASPAGYTRAWSPPAVGDVDGDGAPEIAVMALYGLDGELVVVEGATGEVAWSARDGFAGLSGTAVVDLDDDGAAEVLAHGVDGRVYAYRGDGTRWWTSAEAPLAYALVSFMVDDLDGDGAPEVIADDLVMDGLTGATRARLGTGGQIARQAAAADLDLDGAVELYFQGEAFEPDGTLRWTSTHAPGTLGHWAAPLQADDDPEGEVVFIGQTWALFDTDGTWLVELAFDSAVLKPGPPCMADVDDDGRGEIAFGLQGELTLREADGTVVWSAGVDDSTGAAACAMADLDGDGALEVLYADQDAVRIFDAATGAPRFVLADHASATGIEYPVPADVDADGDTEIVWVQSGDAPPTPLLSVLGHAGDGWAGSRTVWGVHDWEPTCQEPDGGVPVYGGLAWSDPALLRAAPPSARNAGRDLVVEIVDLCVADCVYGPTALSFAVGNAGALDVPAGAEAVVYASDGTHLRELARVALPEVPAASRVAGFTVELGDADGADGMLGVVVDEPTSRPEGRVRECDEANNEAWVSTGC